MSIIIEGMDMPKCCGSCEFNNGYRCTRTETVIDRDYEYQERLSDCPLHEGKLKEWIPVSERLPEKDGRYWVAVEFKHKDGSKDYQTNIATLELRTFFVLEDLFIGEQKRIVAWMPYTEPEPFKAKSEDENENN